MLQPQQGNVQPPMAQEEEQAPITPEEAENDEQALAIRELFQQGYKAIYEGDAFDNLMESIEGGADPVQAITMLLAGIVNNMIKEGGITDLTILFNVAVALMTDLMASMAEIGKELEPGAGQQIVAQGVQLVLQDNPEMMEAVMKNPQMQQLLQQQGIGSEQPPQAPGVMPKTPQPQGGIQ